MKLTGQTLMLEWVRTLNFDLLADQKQMLIELVESDEELQEGVYGTDEHPVWGIVNMIDEIQDFAHNMGVPDVFDEDEDDTTAGDEVA